MDPSKVLKNQVLRQASETPAYLKFLKIRRKSNMLFDGLANFEGLPITTKKNFYLRFPLVDQLKGGVVPPFIYASSGSSGIPTFWYRGEPQNEFGAKMHERAIFQVFSFGKKKRILNIVSFYMGIWVGGNYTLDSLRILARSYPGVAAVTPSTDADKVVSIIERLGSSFDEIVLYGYPAFILDMCDSLSKLSKKFRLSVVTAGAGFTEEWRLEVMKSLRLGREYNRVLSFYGSADLGLVSIESSRSIELKRLLIEDERLRNELVGGDFSISGVFQYDPSAFYIESLNQKLIFTTNTTAGLTLRYEPGDLGTVVGRQKLQSTLNNLSLRLKKDEVKDWPYLILLGRSDVSVVFYAMYVHPEHLQLVFMNPRIKKVLSGDFLAYKSVSGNLRKETLHIIFSGNKGRKVGKTESKMIQMEIQRILEEKSFEYRTIRNELGSQAIPKIAFVKKPSDLHLPSSVHQGVLVLYGKKPRIVKS